MDAEWINANECRRRLRIGRTKIYELLADGEIPGAVKVGNTWRVHWPTLLESWRCRVPRPGDETP